MAVTANGGAEAGVWTAVAGSHNVVAFVDDVNRITNESNESNNMTSAALTVGAAARFA